MPQQVLTIDDIVARLYNITAADRAIIGGRYG
jgi:hypothetical protein